MNVYELNPKKVFEYFALLSSVPHGSGNMKPIATLCENFAKERGLEYVRDAADNVIIKKPGTAGYENAEPVILQGHLDMVGDKVPECDIDMEKESIRIMVDGDYITADGTTLGGDDGIAVAMALAILEDEKAVHPPIEVVLTTDDLAFGGFNRVDNNYRYTATKTEDGRIGFFCYLPSRTATVFKRIKTDCE